MRSTQKAIAVMLSLTLSFSLLGIPAYAAEDEVDANPTTELPISDIADVDDNTDEKQDVDVNAQDESSKADISVETETVDSTENTNSEIDNKTDTAVEDVATNVSMDDAIEFIYIDKAILAIGEEQQIAIGFKKSDPIDEATLKLEVAGQETSLSIEATNIVNNAILFSKKFNNDSEALGYMLAELRYKIADKEYFIDFGAAEIKNIDCDSDSENIEVIEDVASAKAETTDSGYAAYAFDVVTQDLSNAISDSSEMGNEDVSVFALGENGDITAAESVEDAVQIADADGASNVKEDKNIVKDSTVKALGGILVSSEAKNAAEAADITGSVDATNPDGSPTVANGESADFTQETLGENEESSEESPEPEDGNFFTNALDAIVGFFANLFGAGNAWGNASSARFDYLIVAIDPGHGGSDPGACANGIRESDINLSIASHLRDELATYTGVTPYMTRNGDNYVGIQERVDKAAAVGAHVFVSVHCNSADSLAASGSEVWVPNNSSYLNDKHAEGSSLGQKILDQLGSLGLSKRGVKTRNTENNSKYPDGSLRDYYGVIAGSREAGIPGIIVEHAFISNANDASFLKSDSNRKNLGVADATGVANQYGLLKANIAAQNALVSVKSHVANLGWETAVYDRKVSGTVGKNRGIEAFQIDLMNGAKNSGGITYRSNTNGVWGAWVSNGATSGTTGKNASIQAVEMQLTGNADSQYDIYYRAHVANLGWLGWAKGGQSAGSSGYGYAVEAIEVAVVPQGAQAPGDVNGSYMIKQQPLVTYSTHVQDIGWQANAADGGTAGTTGRALRLEGIKVNVQNTGYSGSVRYRTHIENIGWENDWKSNGAVSGTTGRALRLEAIQIGLTGDVANNFDIYYRVHAENIGWMDWAKNGESAGTAGYAYRLEGIQIKLVKKGNSAPGSTNEPFRAKYVKYSTHVENIGWQGNVYDGAVSGTTGHALRLEGIKINIQNTGYAGGVDYRTHVENLGWENNWKSNGSMSGTSGRALRLEAIQIKLNGEIASRYDIYYRVHAQNIGWMDWAKNGASAGTEGYAYRLEGIQIMLVKHGVAGPTNTAEPFRDAKQMKIMGASTTSVDQMVRYFNSQKKQYPASTYASKGAGDINAFCKIVMEEAQAEGVRAEVVFCQAMKETGWLQFGGQVKADQCNFAGLGATNNGANGATFQDVRTGIRAQVQHLKAYASTDKLKNTCVDPRFHLVKPRGCAPYLEDLNGRWAVPGQGYGQAIANMILNMLNK
ncbi:N-acetylmuramoyl-L-alanine amidase [Adlercreutzia sp. ZJ154]|uniref:N-acetylmuramoyl-L-alanine amidase n=1 Tax=Adlercreutzia sp. ZJ154 TaxID=2709790 RepID=UPI0013EB48BF|nr:N-acetylmuramoyl-L-alanine amidase [Adlercreutzia sp. ZJ154]